MPSVAYTQVTLTAVKERCRETGAPTCSMTVDLGGDSHVMTFDSTIYYLSKSEPLFSLFGVDFFRFDEEQQVPSGLVSNTPLDTETRAYYLKAHLAPTGEQVKVSILPDGALVVGSTPVNIANKPVAIVCSEMPNATEVLDKLLGEGDYNVVSSLGGVLSLTTLKNDESYNQLSKALLRNIDWFKQTTPRFVLVEHEGCPIYGDMNPTPEDRAVIMKQVRESLMGYIGDNTRIEVTNVLVNKDGTVTVA